MSNKKIEDKTTVGEVKNNKYKVESFKYDCQTHNLKVAGSNPAPPATNQVNVSSSSSDI